MAIKAKANSIAIHTNIHKFKSFCRQAHCYLHSMKIEIISEERIKPNLPTPHHLRNYKLSALDQLVPHFYMPTVTFFLNDLKTDLNSVLSTRSKNLKQSLSKTLTNFYPFAGKITTNNHLYIDCNDQGVHYVEARANSNLSTFLNSPINVDLIHQLFPYDPESLKSLAKTDVMMIQVNVFSCGGIAISVLFSHQIMDGHSFVTFLSAWAAAARGTAEIYPDFSTVPLLLPQTPLVSPKYNIVSNQHKFITKRFVFDSSSLVSLKAKAASASVVQDPTRFEAVSALIWKCATKTGQQIRPDPEENQVLMVAVNLRAKKSLVPLPKYSIGNLAWSTFVNCMPASIEQCCTVENVRKCLQKINTSFLDEITGENRHIKFPEHVKDFGESLKSIKLDLSNVVTLSSVCNSGISDVDFGWGTPVWNFFDAPVSTNGVFLMDTRLGDGIEALVHLTEQEMAVFECDPELLAFALVDPSPLELM